MGRVRPWLVVALVAVLAVLVLVQSLKDSFVTAGPAPAVVGGIRATHERYPYFCSFVRKGEFGCGGVLIPDGTKGGSKTVLTASHCTVLQNDTVQFGTNKNDARKVAAVKAAVKDHPGFDLKIVTLDRASNKQPIKLATALPKSRSTVWILGRGAKTGDPNKPVDAAFTQAPLIYVDNATAARMIVSESVWSDQTKLDHVRRLRSPTMLVATSPSMKSCKGDSGGPLIIARGPGKDELLGLVSNSPTSKHGLCELAGTRTLYSMCTSIPYYLQTKDRVEALQEKVSRCNSAWRDSKTGRCPRKQPWDTGLPNKQPTVEIDRIMAPYSSFQCSSTKLCVQAVADLYGIIGVTRGTGVRYNPAA